MRGQTPDQPVEAPPAPLAHQLVTGLARLSTWLRARAWREAAPRGLNPTQAQVLAFINTTGGAFRLADIADWLGVTSATASDTVSALDAKGLVTKGRDIQDGRAIAVTLTPRGRREAERGSAGPEGIIQDALSGLTPTEQDVLVKAVLEIIRHLQEQRELPIARIGITRRYYRPPTSRNDPD